MNTLKVFKKLMALPQNKELGATFVEVVQELMALGWKPDPNNMYEEMAALSVLAVMKYQIKKGMPTGPANDDEEEVEKQPIGFMDFKKAA